MPLPACMPAWGMAAHWNGTPCWGQLDGQDHSTSRGVPALSMGLTDAFPCAGCYMGQETLAKVSNRNAVNKQLWGVEVQGPAAAGDLVYKGRLSWLSSCLLHPAAPHRHN